MFPPLPSRAILIGLVLLALPLSRPEVSRADDEADVIAAYNRANELREKGDGPAAAKLYEWALQRAPQVFGPEHENTIGILNNLGLTYYEMGQYAQAETLYQRCLKIRESRFGADSTVVADSLNNLANVYKDMGQYAKAESHYQRSLKIREAKLGPDHLDVAQVLNNLATLYWELSRYQEAESILQRCLKINETRLGPNHLQVAANLSNLSILYQAVGQYARAESLERRALAIRESNVGAVHPLVATSLNNLAKLYQLLGRYAQAEPLYRRSFAIWATLLGPEHPDVALSANNLAELYVDMGQYDKADDLFERVLKIRESKLGAKHPLVAYTLSGMADTFYARRQFDKAESLYLRSLAIHESQFGREHPQVAWDLKHLADVYRRTGQYDKAETHYQQSLKIQEGIFKAAPPEISVGLGVLYTDMRQFGKAEPLLQRALAAYESTYGPDCPDLAYGLNALLSLYGLTDRWSEAVAAVDRERRIVRRHAARTLPALSEKEQITFLKARDEEFLHNALSLGLLRRTDTSTVRQSAGWVLNGKAVAQEVLAQRPRLAAQGADPALAELVKQLQAVRSQLGSLSLTAPKPEQQANHRRRLHALAEQEQELSRQLGQATGQIASSDPWVELDAVRKAIAKDAVLIEVARFRVANFKAVDAENPWLPARYVAWLIPAEGQGEVSIVDLGEAEKIDAAVQTASKALKAAETTIRKDGEANAEIQLRDAMQDLTRFVLVPLEKPLGQARELIVSPDAALWLVPWGALPLPDGKYAAEKYCIRYLVSGRNLVRPETHTVQKPTNPVLFANPDFDLGPGDAEARTRAVLRSAVPQGSLSTSRGQGDLTSLPKVGRLPGTAEEAEAIKPNVTSYAKSEAVVYADQYALEGVFKALHRPRVLVLSTHGFFLPDQGVTGSSGSERTTEGQPLENPLLRCGLLLAGCNQRGGKDLQAASDDGILTGLEIVGTDLRGTDLVVLSACETGLGDIRNGEGVAGLRQAFQLAGANAVVSTLWQIPDEESVDLMNAMFTYLSRGQSKAEALRNAQLTLIKARRADHSAAHPFYWAAFTLTGE